MKGIRSSLKIELMHYDGVDLRDIVDALFELPLLYDTDNHMCVVTSLNKYSLIASIIKSEDLEVVDTKKISYGDVETSILIDCLQLVGADVSKYTYQTITKDVYNKGFISIEKKFGKIFKFKCFDDTGDTAYLWDDKWVDVHTMYKGDVTNLKIVLDKMFFND